MTNDDNHNVKINQKKLETVKRMQQEDEELIPIIIYLTDKTLPENGKEAESLIHKVTNKYLMINGVLYHL